MIRSTILTCALAGLLVGCGSSPESRYYLLSASPAALGATQTNGHIQVIARLPGVLDRPQLVVRTGSETVEIREFERWAEPLEDMISRVLAEDLAQRDKAGKLINNHLTVVIDEFMASTEGSARLVGRWRTTASGDRKFALTLPVEGAEGSRIARTMSSLLGRLADEITGE